MSKSVKSFIAKLLVLCMVVGLLPVVGLAAGTAKAGSDNPYHALDDAYGIDYDTTDGTYKLTDDVVELNGAYEITNDTTLDLKGYYLVIPDTKAIIYVRAPLTIKGPGTISTGTIGTKVAQTVSLTIAKVLNAVTGLEAPPTYDATFFVEPGKELSLSGVTDATFDLAGTGTVKLLEGTKANITVTPDEEGKTPEIVADKTSEVTAQADEKHVAITFDANGGEWTETDETKLGTKVVTAELKDASATIEFPESPDQDGYTFVGWFTDSDPEKGTEVKSDKAFTKADEAQTLYAHWRKNQTGDKYYSITVDAVSNGTVTVEYKKDGETETVNAPNTGSTTVQADRGEDVTVKLTAKDGFKVKSATYRIGNDTDATPLEVKDGQAKFKLTGDATIKAEFEKDNEPGGDKDKYYSITVDAVSYGTVKVEYVKDGKTETVNAPSTGSTTVQADRGKNVTVTLTANEGYEIDTATYTIGETPTDIDKTTGVAKFNLTDNATITATFKSTSGTSTGGGSSSSGSSNTVISKKTANGSFTISNKNAKSGDTVKITPKADKGYMVDQVTVKDKNGNPVEVTKNSDGTYSFVMPDRKLLPVTVDVTFSEITFTDVPANSWYAEAVKYVTENGLMLGVGDGKFAPDMVTSRAMVVTVLYRIEGEPKAGAGEEFTDVADGQWYTDAVAWASANGIVLGYDNGKFGPSDTMTREQLAAVMYRYAEYKGLVSDVSGDFSGYTDDGQISSWAVDAMKWATGTALITGTSETTLTPGGSSTRSQLAVILMRYCENIMK